jgi:hypothetical protein
MGLVDSLMNKGGALAGQAMAKLFEDEKRAGQIAELVGLMQRGRKALDSAQEQALKGLGVASSGEVKAAGKRLAQLRKSARKLDEKLGALKSKLDAAPGEQEEAGA